MSLDSEYYANENDIIIIHSWQSLCAHDVVMSYAHREMIVKHLVFHQVSTWWDSQWSDLNLLCNIILRTLLICRIRNDRNLITKSLHDKIHNDRNQICYVTLINITISFFSIEFDTTHIIHIAWDEVRSHHRSRCTSINYDIIKEYKHCEKRVARERRIKIRSTRVISNCKTLVCNNICEFAIIITFFETHENSMWQTNDVASRHIFASNALFDFLIRARFVDIKRLFSKNIYLVAKKDKHEINRTCSMYSSENLNQHHRQDTLISMFLNHIFLSQARARTSSDRRENEKSVSESQNSRWLETGSRTSDLASAMSRASLERANQLIYRPLRSSLLSKLLKKTY